MRLRIQRCQPLCPVFQFRYWDVHHLAVHSSTPLVLMTLPLTPTYHLKSKSHCD
jgi:hypothetical protein